MLFFCILILCTTSIILSSIVGYFAGQYEQNEFLKNYDIALNHLNRIFHDKQANYFNTIEPLFVSASAYQDLCTLLKTADPDELDNRIKQNTVTMLRDVSKYDFRSVGILLHSNVNERLYQFDKKFQTLNALPLNIDFPEHDPFVLHVLNDTTISSLSTNLYKPSSRVYGLVGTIYEHGNNQTAILGQIIVLYPTSELYDAINSYHLNSEYVFSITDSKGDILFRSSGDYDTSEDLIINKPTSHTAQTIFSPVTIHEKNNISWYTASIYNGRYDYTVTYQIPKSTGRIRYTQTLIIMFAIFSCLFSVGLYILTFRMSSNKVKIIYKGMKKIGSNNLTYRIPTPKDQDEFSQIITGFNHMCDELQQNVEKSYVYELHQKKAELYALQTSINPHFLYNTLELIRLQITHENRNDASQMILLLSKIYRSQIKRDMYVTIEEELDQCENLMFLYAYRFQNFEHSFSIPPALFSYGIPKNTLQPLLENYFIHGLDPSNEDNHLLLTGEMIEVNQKQFIQLTLTNNGHSITPEKLESLKQKLNTSVFENNESNGFALCNVHNRLKIVFGEDSGLYPEIGEDEVGFKIKLIIPPIPLDDLQKAN